MTKGGGKRRRSDVEEEEQIKADEVGLVSDTSHQTGGLYAQTFQQIMKNLTLGRLLLMMKRRMSG